MTKPEHTREPQYRLLLDVKKQRGIARLGLMINEAWQQDPKRMLFVLSRYKFVAKMLSGKKRVLEIGCADAFATRIVQQEVGHVTAIDFDPLFVEDVRERMDPHWKLDVALHDIVRDGPMPKTFDAAYSLDVLEHIPPADEGKFVQNTLDSLTDDGVIVVSLPDSTSASWRVMEHQGANPYWAELEHHHNFSRASLAALLERCGFVIADFDIAYRYKAQIEVFARKSRSARPGGASGSYRKEGAWSWDSGIARSS